MWPCLLLKYCACDGVVSCQSTAPATGLSFWNIGPAALRDLLNTPRSPAAMLRQCEMDWSCHMLLYSVPQQHCRRGCGGSALPAQKLSGEKMQDHMEVRPWRPHGMFFISQERRAPGPTSNFNLPILPISLCLSPGKLSESSLSKHLTCVSRTRSPTRLSEEWCW